jgi:hypothetical protein
MNLREYERESIRRFIESAADEGHLKGRVLDFGCGTGPYRRIIEEHGGEYHPFDRKHFGGNVSGQDVGELLLHGYDAVLCTQVVQYLHYPTDDMHKLRSLLGEAHGHLVMTYPTNWPEVESEDYRRYTKAGMERMLTHAGFSILRHEKRGSVWDPMFDTTPWMRETATGEEFVLGYGLVARA